MSDIPSHHSFSSGSVSLALNTHDHNDGALQSQHDSSQVPPQQLDNSTPSSTPRASNDNAKKRRTSTNAASASSASGRGVSNLTPEQLARKRANDREAQRAIRERTKAHIDRLQKRIRELESQQPYQDLQNVVKQRDAALAENAEIKRKLTTAFGILAPLIGEQSVGTLQLTQQPGPGKSRSAGPATAVNDVASLQASTPSPIQQVAPQRPWPYPGMPPTSNVRSYSSASSYEQQRNSNIHPNLQDIVSPGERMGVEFLLDSNRPPYRPNEAVPQAVMTSEETNTPRSSAIQERSQQPFSTLPRNVGPTTPLDGLLLDFVAEQQRHEADGVIISLLAGPAYPSFATLLNKERREQAHPMSRVLTDTLATFPDIRTLPEQVATLYTMYLIMRWMVSPTQANYDRLPDWYSPRPSQIMTPHPAWIDYVPWPRMRDRLVANYEAYPFESFFIPYTTTVSVNWPYKDEDCLTAVSTQSEDGTTQEVDWEINPIFERHMRDLSNWSLGPAFAEEFPALGETARIRQ